MYAIQLIKFEDICIIGSREQEILGLYSFMTNYKYITL